MANAPGSSRDHWPELSLDTNYYQRMVEAQRTEEDKESIRAAFRFLRVKKARKP